MANWTAAKSFFIPIFFLYKKIVKMMSKKKLQKMKKEVPSRPLYSHPAATQETTFSPRVA